MALVRVIIILLLLLLSTTSGDTQELEKGTAIVWDLETCIRYAKQHNIRLNSLLLEQKTSEQELLLSKAARMPDLYASATQFVTHNNMTVNTAGNHGKGTFGSGDYGLNSSWTLYRGGYLSSDVRQKNLNADAADLKILQQQNEIILQIIQYYLNIMLDKENIVYSQSLVSASAAQVNRARRQLTAGSIAKKELLQLEAQLANDKYILITAENAKRQDLVNLKQLLQLPFGTELDILVPDSLQVTPSVEKLLEVRKQALKNRPEVKNGIIGIEIAKVGLEKANAGYKPSLTLSSFIGSSYIGSSSNYFRQFSNNFSQQLGLSLSVPIFTRRLNTVNVAKAKIELEQAKLNLMDTQTTLSLTIERAYINLVSAQNQFQAATEAFKYNMETYRVAGEQLNTGLINMVEYLQQKTLYIQAQQQFLQAKYNAALSAKIYDFYKGNPETR